MHNTSYQRGSIIVSLLVIMIFLTITVLSLGAISQTNIQRSVNRILLLQAQYAAESGADIALSYLNEAQPAPTGQKMLMSHAPYYSATYEVAVSDIAANSKKALSIGRVYRPAVTAAQLATATPDVTYKLEVGYTRSSTSMTSSILSRNSVEIDSSVKEVKAKSLFVNEYIKANKNGNLITIDDLTVAGKYPDSTNCSILGAGDLNRSPELVALGQKAKIHTGNNVCISPPGNTSNSNFDVTANDSSIQKIASTQIPWDFKMNGNDGNGVYSNGPCSDWGQASPVTIPRTTARKSHYPDTNDGVIDAFACTFSGSAIAPNKADLNLSNRTYIIKDHVHVRAHLCRNYTCTPTFKNPDNDTKFIFVEGVINFQNITVDDNSVGNIAFISYSTSQTIAGSKQCPSNLAAIRIGKDGSNAVNAPKAYFIAVNGMLCIDQTKFLNGAASLGGISGKDLYISSNSGGVFYLTFNPQFPLSDIPLDLAWRTGNIKRLY